MCALTQNGVVACTRLNFCSYCNVILMSGGVRSAHSFVCDFGSHYLNILTKCIAANMRAKQFRSLRKAIQAHILQPFPFQLSNPPAQAFNGIHTSYLWCFAAQVICMECFFRAKKTTIYINKLSAVLSSFTRNCCNISERKNVHTSNEHQRRAVLHIENWMKLCTQISVAFAVEMIAFIFKWMAFLGDTWDSQATGMCTRQSFLLHFVRIRYTGMRVFGRVSVAAWARSSCN